MPKKGQVMPPLAARQAADKWAEGYAAAEKLYFDADKHQRERLVRWAKSLTSTNCGWSMYYVGLVVIASHDRCRAASKRVY